MNKKLTLSHDKAVVEQAKRYTKSNNTSLLKIIESYMSTLPGVNKEIIEITLLVESLIGVVEMPDDFNENDAVREYFIEKHG